MTSARRESYVAQDLNVVPSHSARSRGATSPGDQPRLFLPEQGPLLAS